MFRNNSERFPVIIFHLFLACLVGVLGALVSRGFVVSVEWLQNLWSADLPQNIGFVGWSITVKMAIILSSAALLIGLLMRYFHMTRLDGPADTILSVQGKNGTAQVPIKEGFVSSFAAIIGLGAGSPAGQYGSLLHLGASCASFISKYMKLPRDASEILLACGVASFISASFSAPLAGMICAHELVLRHYSMRHFAPVTLSSVIAYAFVNHIFIVDRFFPPLMMQGLGIEDVFFLLSIGVCGGFIAVYFMKIYLYTVKTFQNMPVMLRPMIAAFIVFCVGIFIPQILGSGMGVIYDAISGELVLSYLLLFCVLKLCLSAIAIALSLHGGVFAPAMFIGTMLGAIFGYVLDENIALYAVAGMGAVISAVIGAPITTILIVFELTQNYSVVTGVMIAVVFSNLVSYRFFGRSLYDEQLRARGERLK